MLVLLLEILKSLLSSELTAAILKSIEGLLDIRELVRLLVELPVQ